MRHPFAELLGIEMREMRDGGSVCAAPVKTQHFNPQGVLHGGVAYALADTGMGGAVYSQLEDEQRCATIEITIHYFAPVRGGELVCRTTTVQKGKRVVTLESEVRCGEELVAKALGTYAVF